MSAREKHNVDVVIAGAGLAGLYAAYKLERAGISVCLLEARDRVGGRLHSQKLDDGSIVEFGGQWLGPKQDRALALARELDLDLYPTWDTGKNIFYWRGRKSTYSGLIPKISPLALLDFKRTQSKFDRMARKVPLDCPWQAKKAREWDSQTLESWIRKQTLLPAAAMLFRLYAGAVFATEAADLSLLHALYYTHSGEGTDHLASVKNGAQAFRIQQGAQALATRLAERLNAKIHLNTPVQKIGEQNNAIEIIAGNSVYSARYAIITVPRAILASLRFEPQLPPMPAQLLQRTPAGSVIKCHAVYPSPFWRDDGFSGQVTSDTGPVRITFDNGHPEGKYGILMAFIEGADARALSMVSAAERRAAVLSCLQRYFGEQALSPSAFHECDWSAEIRTGGCYGTHLPPGVWTGYGRFLRQPHGRMHFAGADIAARWNGYMDGAIGSGLYAAEQIIAALAR